MRQRIFMNAVLICLSILLGLSLFSSRSFAGASGSGDSDCPTISSGTAAGSGSAQDNCNSCITAAIYENLASGDEIINAMFTTINSVLDKVMKSFFNGIVSSTNFQAMIGAAIVLYVAMYGIMITFGLISHKINEVATRLVKMGFVYAITAPNAWTNFTIWVYNPIIGGMNQLIKEFTQTAESGSGFGSGAVGIFYGSSVSGSGLLGGASGGLNAHIFDGMFGSSMTSVFSVQLFTAITSLIGTGFFGWLIAIFLMWGLVEFLLMMIGAVITYAKAIIGLAFLFGIAPLFFTFLLFERTRPLFMSWVYHVIAFALQPVFLFAFLSFYIALINQAVPYLLTDGAKNQTNFCWTKWFSVPGQLWEAFTWRPTSSGEYTPLAWANASNQVAPSPINVPNAIYFLMLCHLGRTFTKFIDTLANDISGGIGPGTVRGQDLSDSAKKVVGGGFRGARTGGK